MFNKTFLILVCAGALVACDDDGASGPVMAGEPEDFADYFATTPYGVSACDARDGQLAGERELRLFQNGVSNVKPFTQGLQRYFDRHDLRFFTRYPPQKVSTSYALNTNLTEIERELRKQFPDVDFDGPAPGAETEMLIVRAAANLMLKPLVSFAESHGQNGTGQTNLVFLTQLLRPGGEDIFPGDATLAGLAISPALITRLTASGLDEAAIWEGVSFPPNFTPMMFLDARVIDGAARQVAVARDLVVAHEFGHTGALVHREQSENLMLPGLDKNTAACTVTLLPDQIVTLQQTLGVGPSVPQAQAQTLVAAPAPHGDTVHTNYLELRALLTGASPEPPSFLRALFHHREPR